MKITVESAKQVWEKNDKRIYEVVTDGGVKYKTYSDKIGKAREGDSFDVDTYEKDGRNGKEIFIKQVQKDGGGYGGGGGAARNNFPVDPLREVMMLVSYSKDLEVAMISAGHTKEYNVERIVNTALDMRDLITEKTGAAKDVKTEDGPGPIDTDTLTGYLKEDADLYEKAKVAGWGKKKLVEVYIEHKCKGKKQFLEAVDSELSDL